MYSLEGDRQAALALPLAVLSRGDVREGEKRTATFLPAIEMCTCSPSVEVRQCVAEGLRTLFDRPCGIESDGRCWHEGVWRAIALRPAGGAGRFLGKWPS